MREQKMSAFNACRTNEVELGSAMQFTSVVARVSHGFPATSTGTLLWLLPLGGDLDTTPAIARDGTIYVAGDTGLLQAFR